MDKKKLLRMIANLWFEVPFWVNNKLNIRHRNGSPKVMMDMICKAYEKYNKEFCAYNLRPKYSIDVIEPNVHKKKNKSYAIVIQGPIKKEDNFTVETVKIYKKIFKDAIIIISTWEDESKELMEELGLLGCIIIINRKPDINGYSNVNYQLVSSLGGILKAKELGLEYVFKTRTDQRIYSYYTFEYFVNLLELLPNDDTINKIQRNKIITANGGQMYAPYWLQDFLYFGTCYDMYTLFNIPLDVRNYTEIESINLKHKTMFELSEIEIPEVYIIKNYLKKMLNCECVEHSVKEFWNYLKKYFICVSFQDIDLYWYKYDKRLREHTRMDRYNGISTVSTERMPLSFVNYINIAMGSYIYLDEYEEYAKSSL